MSSRIVWEPAPDGTTCRNHMFSGKKATATLRINKEDICHLCEECVIELHARTEAIIPKKGD